MLCSGFCGQIPLPTTRHHWKVSTLIGRGGAQGTLQTIIFNMGWLDFEHFGQHVLWIALDENMTILPPSLPKGQTSARTFTDRCSYYE